MKNTYQTRQLLEILGLSRDALRYYENVGVITPEKNALNQYRQFSENDLYTLMVTDFYKKRNVTVKEVKQLQSGKTIQELALLFQQKSDELEQTIINQMHMLKKIKESKEFCERVDKHLNSFSIRQLPAFQTVHAFSDFYAFLEYPGILEKMDYNQDDLLSRMLRVYRFTEDEITDSKMYLMKEYEADQLSGETLEQQFPCMYTIVEDSSKVDTEKDRGQTVFKTALAWGKKQGLKPKGSAFVVTRLITYMDKKESAYLEVYVPIEEIS